MSVRAPGDWSMRNLSTGALVYLNPSPTSSANPSVQELHAHIHQCRAELSLLKHSLGPKNRLLCLAINWSSAYPAPNLPSGESDTASEGLDYRIYHEATI